MLQNRNGTYRYLVKVDPVVFTPAYAKTLGVSSIHWIDATTGLGCVSSKSASWDLTAEVDDAVDWAFHDLAKAPGKRKKEFISEQNVPKVKQLMKTQIFDPTTEWSAYKKNVQWSLQAMGATVPAEDQSDPDNRTPVWNLNQPAGLPNPGRPYEGSGVVVGFFGGLPTHWPNWNTGFDWADKQLHPSFDMYRGQLISAKAPAGYFTEDPALGQVHAAGGVIGFDLLSDAEKGIDLAVGDGVKTTFVSLGITELPSTDILPGTVKILYYSGANSYLITDDGAGVLEGDGTGTVDYATGAVTGSCTTAPGDGSNISGYWRNEQPLQSAILENDATNEAWGLSAQGIACSRAVGSSEVPNSQITTKDIRGRMRGLAPMAKMICYKSSVPVYGDYNIPVSELLQSLLLAITHKVQVFAVSWSPNFWVQEPRFADAFRIVMDRTEAANMLVVFSAGFDQIDFDRSKQVLPDYLLGERGHCLLVGGTGPRDYQPLAADLSVYTPDPERAVQPVANNLDRIAVESINLWEDLVILGFGGPQTMKLDLVVPMGSIDPLIMRTLTQGPDPIPVPWADVVADSMVHTTYGVPGGWSSLTGWGVFIDETGASAIGPHGKNAHDGCATGHAVGAAVLVVEAYKLKNGTYPSAKRVKNLLRNTADGKVGPAQDFSFIAAPRKSIYDKDVRYILAWDPATGEGDKFGYTQPWTWLVAGGMGVCALWYSYQHPADKSSGRDPMYGMGRINLKAVLDAVNQ